MIVDGSDIIPYVRVGNLRFGMTRAQTRALLGGDVSIFKKGSNASIGTDAYDRLNLHLH